MERPKWFTSGSLRLRRGFRMRWQTCVYSIRKWRLKIPPQLPPGPYPAPIADAGKLFRTNLAVVEPQLQNDDFLGEVHSPLTTTFEPPRDRRPVPNNRPAPTIKLR